MRRTLAFAFVAAVAMLTPAVILTGQRGQPPRDPVPPPPPAQQPARDPSQPAMRQVPVGTATISGTVTVADTGRPIRGARVSLSGGVGSPGARLGGVSAGASGGVSVGLQPAPGGRGGPVQGGMISSVSRTAITDAQGQFSFGRLPAGQYMLNASRQQFLAMAYGQRKPGGQGTIITLIDSQSLKVAMPLMRGGVITGLVIGEDGDPLPNTQVRAVRVMLTNGVKRMQDSGFAQSDDRGVYRLFGLQPGDYMVSATPSPSDIMMSDRLMADTLAIEQAIASGAVRPPAAPGLPATVAIPAPQPGMQMGPTGPPPGYLPTYAPSAAMLSAATVVHVAGGDEHASVDIQVRLVQSSTIEGTIAGPIDQGVSVQISLMSDDPMANVSTLPSTRANADGKFTLRGIAPGKYIVAAQTVPAPQTFTVVNGVPNTPQPGRPTELLDSQKRWGRAPVTVEGESSISVNLPLRAGRSISGTVVFEMARVPDLNQARVVVMLTMAPSAQSMSFGPQPQAPVGPDGRFTMNGVIPGRYILRATTGVAKSSMVNGQDTLDVPLEFTGEQDVADALLTVTDTITEIGGTLTNAAGKPGLDYTIVVASSDERFWTPGSRRIVTTRTSPDGRYVIRNIPPGSYLVAAVTDLEPGGQFDPDLLKSLRTASITVTLGEGMKLIQDLRVAR